MDFWQTLTLIFTDYTLRNVALGAAILGIVSGALSTFAVLRKQSLVGDAVSHAALPGVVLAFILTNQKEPLVLMAGAIIAGWLGVTLVSLVVRETRVKYDSALGIVLAVFFGFGMVLMTWLQGQNNAGQSGLDHFLFGRAAAIIESDVVTMAVLGGVVLLVVGLFWKEFKLLSFDGQYAATLGFPVRHLDTLLTTLIVVAVVLGLQMVGVVLMSAMVVAPAAAARQWTDRLGPMMILSSVFGAVAGVSGAVISSLTNNLPTGPTIVLCISAIVVVSLLFAPNRGIVWSWLRNYRNRHNLQKAMLLEKLYDASISKPDAALPVESLRFILTGGTLEKALDELRMDGYIVRDIAGEWSLTVAGTQAAQALQAPGAIRKSALFTHKEAAAS
jgi:manganese/zinc/iron transport system permease protein